MEKHNSQKQVSDQAKIWFKQQLKKNQTDQTKTDFTALSSNNLSVMDEQMKILRTLPIPLSEKHKLFNQEILQEDKLDFPTFLMQNKQLETHIYKNKWRDKIWHLGNFIFCNRFCVNFFKPWQERFIKEFF